MCFNRLLSFQVVRGTRPCQFTPACFIGKREYRNLRDAGHVAKCPDYPDPQYYLSFTQKYFFRNASLRHLRVEQFNRYLGMAGEAAPAHNSVDDTVEAEDAADVVDTAHRNYDEAMEATPQGTHFLASCKHVPGCRRRRQSCLGVSRVPFIEPVGGSREDFYEAKLILALSWYCPALPEVVHREDGSACTEYTFQWDPPDDLGGQYLDSVVLKLGRESVNFEVVCNLLEKRFCEAELGLVCGCCAETALRSVCPSCAFATGWHKCTNDGHFLWRKGSLHAGSLDVQRCLFNLHRKMLPIDALREKAARYVENGLISADMADRIIQAIEGERNHAAILNEDVDAEPQAQHLTTRLSTEDLQDLLAKREAMMQEGVGETDQWRVYRHIVGCIERGELLRLMVQASAGTGNFHHHRILRLSS